MNGTGLRLAVDKDKQKSTGDLVPFLSFSEEPLEAPILWDALAGARAFPQPLPSASHRR